MFQLISRASQGHKKDESGASFSHFLVSNMRGGALTGTLITSWGGGDLIPKHFNHKEGEVPLFHYKYLIDKISQTQIRMVQNI